MGSDSNEYIAANWPAPPQVRAFTTTRGGGVSQGGYASFNLADHVGDDPAAAAHNRAQLRAQQQLPCEPLWLRQVHGVAVVDAAHAPMQCVADGSYTDRVGVVCAVLTADCLPVLLCDRRGTRVAAVHAGWRGLLAGAIEAGVAALDCAPRELLAWLGPAIGPQAFVVGDDVRAPFVAHDAAAALAFRAHAQGRWTADLYTLARQRLARIGVEAVYGGGLCTFNDPKRFFSYRREQVCGRMASLIWLQSP